MQKRTSDFEFEEEYKTEIVCENEELFNLQENSKTEKINNEVLNRSMKIFEFQEELSLAPLISKIKNKKTISMRGICKKPKNH